MTDHLKIFEKVCITPSALKSPSAKRALKIFPRDMIHIVEEGDFKKGRPDPLQIGKNKKVLLFEHVSSKKEEVFFDLMFLSLLT